MKIQVIMEVPDKYIGAYDYYKKNVDSRGNMTRDALISQAARMFNLPNIKRFYDFVKKMEENEQRGFVR